MQENASDEQEPALDHDVVMNDTESESESEMQNLLQHVMSTNNEALLQTYLETEKIRAEKMENQENKAIREHEVIKLQIELEKLKLKSEAKNRVPRKAKTIELSSNSVPIFQFFPPGTACMQVSQQVKDNDI